MTRLGPAPSRWRTLVELVALCGFAFAQPLLDIFGRAPDQFAFRGASDAHIVAFVAAMAFGPPIALWVGELMVGLFGTTVRQITHVLLMTGLVAVVVVQAARSLTTGAPLFALAAVSGVVAVLAYGRFAPVRLWLAYAAVAPAGFVALFLLSAPTSRLLGREPDAADVAVDHPAPVVMVVLDEFPLESLIDADGAIDAELFPHFAALAADAHWFRNTTSVSPSTWHAVPAIATGQRPRDGTAPSAADHPQSLFTLLGSAYDLDVTESVTRLCPATLCASSGTTEVLRGLAGDAKRVLRSRLSWSRRASDPVAGLAPVAPPEADFGDFALNQPDRFRSLIDGLSDDPGTLHYLHLLLPHVPYRYLPSGAVYEGPDPDFGRIFETDSWDEQEWPAVIGRQRHVLQVMYVDRLLGVLIDEMREAGVYDDALLVVTADHGISFDPGGAIRADQGQVLTDASTADLLWVPLFIKEPGQATGDVSDGNVLTIDIVPTIADVLGVEIPWAVDGRSALGPERASTEKPWWPADVIPFGVAVGDEVTVDGDAGWLTVLARSLGHFLPPAGDPERLWRVGPSPELVGKQVDDVDAGRLVPMIVELDEATALVRAHGGGLHEGDAVAVAIDGEIAATGVAFRVGDRVELAVMVAEERVAAGGEQIVVYRIS